MLTTRLDRIVPIKILPENLAADPQFHERFQELQIGEALAATAPKTAMAYDPFNRASPEPKP
jgi:hypothetical protein